jgi:hypothetical protein
MWRGLIAAVALLAAGALAGQAQQAAADNERRAAANELTDAQIVKRIGYYKRQTWHWQRVLGKRRTTSGNTARAVANRQYRLWVLDLWQQRAARIWRQAKRPPHKGQWLCIHRYEGHWRSTPGGPGILNSGGPYYGGLQMDLEFQRTYGGYLLRKKGTADRWSPLEQMWVAERAHRTRGFYPWPNTARLCGLI